MGQEFHVLRCFSCEVFQVQQVKKVNKWSCKVCGQNQSVIKEFGRGSGADCRRHVQKLNATRGAKMEEANEHRTKMEEANEHRAKMDPQLLWSESAEHEQLLNKQVQSRWDKYLPVPEEEAGAEPEESAVVMDRDLFSSSKHRTNKREPDLRQPRKRRRTDQEASAPGSSSRDPPPSAPLSAPSPPLSAPSPPLSAPSPPLSAHKSVPSVVPPLTTSKWRTFLNQPRASGSGPEVSPSVLFQSGEDLSWSDDWSWT